MKHRQTTSSKRERRVSPERVPYRPHSLEVVLPYARFVTQTAPAFEPPDFDASPRLTPHAEEDRLAA